MKQHELILLSPYRFPGQNPLTLGNEDMAAWLNGFTALWHPAALWQAKAPPRVDVPYDHEQPQADRIYCIPESPPIYLPDDWDQRVVAAGAVAFRSTTDRLTTLQNLLKALENQGTEVGNKESGGRHQDSQDGEQDRQIEGKDRDSTNHEASPFAQIPSEQLEYFFGLGLGHLFLGTLAEAMEHENLLEAEVFWDHVQEAIASLAGFPYTPISPKEQTTPSDYPAYSSEDFPDPENQEFTDYPDPGSAVPPSSFEEFTNQKTEDGMDRPEGSGLEGGPSESENGRQEIENPKTEDAPPSAPDSWLNPLRSAAEKLLSAREVLYPVTIYLLDLVVLDEQKLDQPWPAAFEKGIPVNVLASSSLLEKLAQAYPERMGEMRGRVQGELAEVCGGTYLEREDPFLPIDSQLWNLRKGQDTARDILGTEIRVFARKRFGFHPMMPLLLSTSGLTRALFLTFHESEALPQYQTCVVGLPSPDGKQIDAFVRAPHPADNANTFFNLCHYWFKTQREDHAATLALAHQHQPALPWYRDLMSLAQLAPVMGQWCTFSKYFNEVTAGEHGSALAADDFHYDYLSERTALQMPDPVSGFARNIRLRRRLDTCYTLAALHRSLGSSSHPVAVGENKASPESQIRDLEDQLEKSLAGKEAAGPAVLESLDDLEKRITHDLAERLQARAESNQPGYLVLNPCNFTRRLALELEGAARPLAIADPVKACQLDGNMLKVVVEVPPLGFAWIPKEGPPGTPPPPARLRLADRESLTLRNEFFEVEIDGLTGGLKAIRDHKTHLNRLGQRLVFNPGSRMEVREIQATSTGPALGEIITSGELLGEQNQVLATFRQRFRVWLGRPVLELRIEIDPKQPPAGYPWHAYFGARFAWRDERAMMLRGLCGTGYLTSHTRPQSPDFLELRMARQGTVIFPGGLPFHQRQEGRMLDVILIPEGEKAQAFDLAIALDRDQPMLTGLGLVTPTVVVPTSKGPPHVGASGWLFHLDASNLLLTQMVPGTMENRSQESGIGDPGSEMQKGEEAGDSNSVPVQEKKGPPDAVTARLLECSGNSGHAEFRCVRNPRRACLLDARGNFLLEATTSGDAVFLEITPNDLVHAQIEFG